MAGAAKKDMDKIVERTPPFLKQACDLRVGYSKRYDLGYINAYSILISSGTASDRTRKPDSAQTLLVRRPVLV